MARHDTGVITIEKLWNNQPLSDWVYGPLHKMKPTHALLFSQELVARIKGLGENC